MALNEFGIGFIAESRHHSGYLQLILSELER